MATDLGQAKTPTTTKHDAFVQTQLSRTEKRIRTLDLTAALLGLAGGTLAYAAGMALLDRWLTLSESVRQAGVVVYLLTAAAYLTAFVVLPLSRRINPYFAARQLERTMPGAKNSVVNWLDLHGENLPPAIRGAVGQRAAKDLARADLEKAVSGRRAYTAGGVASVGAVAFLIALFTIGFGPFFGLIARAFIPFGANGTAPLPTRTQITVVKPVDGDAVVADLRPVEILVRVDGRVPDPKAADALKVQFRYEPSGPYQHRLLEPDDGGRWGVTLQPVDVQDGFWYKVTGGDAETPEYRVRQTPRILDFKAVYQFRPYTARVKETRKERRIEALRGTQVDVTVRTNRDVKDGWLQFDGTSGTTVTHGERSPNDPQAFVVHMVLDESSQYRICFASVENENFVETQASPLIAVPDKPPVVTLTSPAELKDKPGWIASLPSDALLPLEGSATDDVGVKAMRLNLQVEKGPTLPPQEYRTPKDFQLEHGGNPTTVEYKDFVDLKKFNGVPDPLFTVRPGMVLEYWLTAEDACDYPDPNKPNIGESKHYRVQIIDPLNNDKVRQQQQDKAAADKKDGQQKQDQQQQDEDKKREDERKQQEQNNQANDKGSQQGANQHQPGNNPDAKPDDQPKPGMGDPKPGDHGQEANKPDNPNQQNPGDNKNNPNPDQGKSQAEQKDLKDTLKDAADKIRKNEEGKGKPDAQQHPADGKDGGKPEKQPQPGDAKDAGGPQEKKDASESKGGPQDKPGEKHDEGAAKEQGRPDPMQPQQQQGEAKPGGDPKGQPDAQPGQGKDGKTESAPKPAENKDGGKPDEQKQAGTDKSQTGAQGDKTEKAESKEGNPPNAQPAGEGKDKAAPENKSEAKGSPQDNSDKDSAKSKGNGATNPMDDPKPATAKSSGDKTDQQAKAQPKPDGSEGEPPTDQDTQKGVDDAFKKLQDDLKSSDPKRREAAEDFMRRYLMDAKDKDIRDRAKKTLEGAGLDPNDDKLATPKPEEPPNAPPKDPMEPKDPPAQSKPQGQGPDKDTPSTSKDNPPDDPPNDPKKGESKGDGKPMNGDPMKETPPPATAKGGPGNGAFHRDPTSPSNDVASPAATNEKPVAQRASTLQLLNFYQAVPKDVLKDAMLDPEKLKALEDAMRNFLAKHPADAKDDLAGPQHGGALPNQVGKTSDPNGKSPNDDPNNGARAQPPPEYRGPYKDFTKLLSPGDK